MSDRANSDPNNSTCHDGGLKPSQAIPPDSCYDCHRSDARFLLLCVQADQTFYCCDKCFRRRKSNGMGRIECREIWRT